ncbi:hypothetical protein HMI54_015155 [Coelomomyces lativittatus]|nr:hypothetical protein HMI56_004699 [Coelomomyces lativittatus]KAJ1513228.1 hypothetical protein HMI54_015155 [Coelomomyces lativittatus]
MQFQLWIITSLTWFYYSKASYYLYGGKIEFSPQFHNVVPDILEEYSDMIQPGIPYVKDNVVHFSAIVNVNSQKLYNDSILVNPLPEIPLKLFSTAEDCRIYMTENRLRIYEHSGRLGFLRNVLAHKTNLGATSMAQMSEDTMLLQTYCRSYIEMYVIFLFQHGRFKSDGKAMVGDYKVNFISFLLGVGEKFYSFAKRCADEIEAYETRQYCLGNTQHLYELEYKQKIILEALTAEWQTRFQDACIKEKEDY